MLAHFRYNNEIAIAVASSGIASLLLDGATTAHSKFHIPIKIHEDSVCNLSLHSEEAKLMKKAKIFIWDEAPMCNKLCLETVDRFLRDLMKSNRPFGGKKFLIGGDFRQTLPVVLRGLRADIINASIKSSHVWRQVKQFKLTTNMRLLRQDGDNYPEFLINVGNGTLNSNAQSDNSSNEFIDLPNAMWLPLEKEQLFDRVYDNFLESYTDPQYIYKRAILSPLNADTDVINQIASDKLPGHYTTYLSYDSIVDQDNNNNFYFNTEYLNSLKISGLPPHQLDLKIDQPIILLRNISASNGLCNGSRLIIKGNIGLFETSF